MADAPTSHALLPWRSRLAPIESSKGWPEDYLTGRCIPSSIYSKPPALLPLYLQSREDGPQENVEGQRSRWLVRSSCSADRQAFADPCQHVTL
jgi:hypothetical protein